MTSDEDKDAFEFSDEPPKHTEDASLACSSALCKRRQSLQAKQTPAKRKVLLPDISTLQPSRKKTEEARARPVIAQIRKWCKKADDMLSNGECPHTAQILRPLTDTIFIHATDLIPYMDDELCAEIADAWERCTQVCWMDHPLTTSEIEILRRWVKCWLKLPGITVLENHSCEIFPEDKEEWLERDEELRCRDWDDQEDFAQQKEDIELWMEMDHAAIVGMEEETIAEAKNASGVFDDTSSLSEVSMSSSATEDALATASGDTADTCQDPVDSSLQDAILQAISLALNSPDPGFSHVVAPGPPTFEKFADECNHLPGAVRAYMNDDVGDEYMVYHFYEMDKLSLYLDKPDGGAFNIKGNGGSHRLAQMELCYDGTGEVTTYIWTV